MKIEIQYDAWLSDQSNRLKSNKSYKKGFVGERGYKHFDRTLSIKDAKSDRIKSEACNFDKLKHHKFWPFIREDKMTRRFTKNQKNEVIVKHKNRHLMYASHLDAIIMSFYAWILKNNYEHKIQSTLANETVIGYRKIPLDPRKNKSNIDFAFDVYEKLLHISDSVVLCIDIEDFFGNINHNLLIKKVQPFIHESIFRNFAVVLKSVTKYKYIFKHDIERKLGRKQRWDNPRQYNAKIKKSNVIHKNNQEKGIPQGSPISDILANIYLYDFDLWLSGEIQKYPGAFYRRYSDDIILIIPQSIAKTLYKELCVKLKQECKINISLNKTEAFYVDAITNSFDDITNKYTPKRFQYCKKKNMVQYLGFLMNFNCFMLRPGTISNYYRKEIAIMKRICAAKFGKKNVKCRRGFIKVQRASSSMYYKLASKKSGTVYRQVHRINRRVKRLKKNMRL